jgi:hypothetical protein
LPAAEAVAALDLLLTIVVVLAVVVAQTVWPVRMQEQPVLRLEVLRHLEELLVLEVVVLEVVVKAALAAPADFWQVVLPHMPTILVHSAAPAAAVVAASAAMKAAVEVAAVPVGTVEVAAVGLPTKAVVAAVAALIILQAHISYTVFRVRRAQ